MFDADYFGERLSDDVRAMGGSVTVTVITHSGDRFVPSRVRSTEEGYVVLYVYPVDGSKPEMRDDWQKAQDRSEPIHNFDLVALAYDHVARVELSRAPHKDFGVAGFQVTPKSG